MRKNIIQLLEIQDTSIRKIIIYKKLYINKKIENLILNKNKKIQWIIKQDFLLLQDKRYSLISFKVFPQEGKKLIVRELMEQNKLPFNPIIKPKNLKLIIQLVFKIIDFPMQNLLKK